MELLDVYKSLLSTAGMTADQEGFISARLAKTDPKPVLIKGQRLVLPTHDQLRQPDNQNRVRFHPLSESILRGESDVVVKFREYLNQRLNFIIGYVSISLMTLATSPAQHTELSPDQALFLNKVKDADEGTLERFTDITKLMMAGDASKSFAHIFVRKNGTMNGKQYRRLGTVSFPFYEEVLKVPKPKEPNEIYGVKLRKVDRESFKGLMEYLLPNIAEPTSYFRGNEFDVAPTLEALMKAVIAIGDPLNSVVELFKNFIDDSEDLYFNGEWEETFQNLPAMLPQIRMVPPQAGNEGNAANVGGAPLIAVNTTNNLNPQPAHHRGAAPESEPVKRLAIQAPESLGSMSHNPTLTQPAPAPTSVAYPANIRQPQPAPMYPAPAQQFQQPPYPQGGYMPQPQPVYQPPPIRRTEFGVDFASVLQANPALMANLPPQQQPYGGQMMPQQRPPGWAYGGSGSGYGGGGGFGSI